MDNFRINLIKNGYFCCSMKKISANYLFPGNAAPIKNGVVVVDNRGTILEVIDPAQQEVNWEEIEQYEGILCPGFVNTHCHLELSHLKENIVENTQLPGFIKEVVAVKSAFTDEERLEAIKNAEQEMWENGIVAVGDISNGATTFQQKSQSRIKYHTFLEVFDLTPQNAEQVIDKAQDLMKQYYNPNRISITPHAPYSMSTELLQLVGTNSEGGLITIHNQETESENELFLKKSGDLYNRLLGFNDAIKEWEPTGLNSLPSYLRHLSNQNKFLLVHNTFTQQEDVAFAHQYAKEIYWCFCPNANRYIEGKEPNYDLFLPYFDKCTIGTDSLASNWSLSILDELKTISKNKSISLETLIRWATWNGAKFLNFNMELGSIEKGKTPGINLIEQVNLNTMTLTEASTVKKLM